jgi:hypothetical protein
MNKRYLMKDLVFYGTVALLLLVGYTLISGKFGESDAMTSISEQVEEDCRQAISMKANSASVSFGDYESFEKAGSGYAMVIRSSQGRFKCVTDQNGNIKSLIKTESFF